MAVKYSTRSERCVELMIKEDNVGGFARMEI